MDLSIWQDIYLAVSTIVEELKGKTDINIVLSHTELVTDLKKSNIEGVDAVLAVDNHYYISYQYRSQKNYKISCLR